MANQSGRYVDNGEGNIDNRGQAHIFPVQYTQEEHLDAIGAHEFTRGLDPESYPFAPSDIDKNTYPKELQYYKEIQKQHQKNKKK